jgi:hypothetical protein
MQLQRIVTALSVEQSTTLDAFHARDSSVRLASSGSVHSARRAVFFPLNRAFRPAGM